MINYKIPGKKKPQEEILFDPDKVQSKCKRLLSISRASKGILNEIYNPVDAANRYINLTLQELDESSQGREFLLESKKGVKRISALLEKLNFYAKKIEKELSEISINRRQSEPVIAKRQQSGAEVSL